MRLSVLSTPLLLASTTFARSPLRRGPTTDTCASLDAHLVFSDVLINDQPYDAGRIHVGLCISQVDTFVGHYNVTEAAAKVVGVDKVKSTVIAMINKEGAQCSYPQHARPTVSRDNECDFACMDGFMAVPANNPSSCYCPPHLVECDGKCGQFPFDCSTTAPLSRRQNQPKCGKDLTMCGVPDAAWGQAFKCTNVTSDSYTCGGCVKASPFGSPSTDGVNCHEIPNVDEVFCKDSKCFVHSCKDGFTISDSNNGCVAKKTTRASPLDSGSSTVTGALHALPREELPGKIVPGSVVGAKVPRTDDGAGQVLSTGKAALGGVQSSVANDTPSDPKLPRGFVPFTSYITSTVAGDVGEAGSHLTRDVDKVEHR